QGPGGSFSADDPKPDTKLLRPVSQQVIQVPAYLASRQIPRREVHAVIFRGHRPEQRALDPFCRLQIALQPRLFLCELFVKMRIFERHRQIRGEDRKRSEEHTSELQSRSDLVCRLLLEK